MSQFSFIHVGDVHIGKARLGGRLPSQDFADTFDRMVDAAIDRGVAFVLVAGDFFDKARIEPNHLAEAQRGLARLAEAEIPLVAIEGNHDVVSSYEDRPSWLSYLNRIGLVRLLRTEFRQGKPLMKEWTKEDPQGNWMDLAGARIYGAGWFGASTARRLELLAPELEKRGTTILMLHAGINGMAEEFGMLDRKQLAVVKDGVDLVVLGHMHKEYVVDGYAYNAGAMECWDLGEAKYGERKGYWLFEVDGESVTPSHHPVPRRPVHLARFDSKGLASFDAMLEGIVEDAKAWSLTPETAVRLHLVGIPGFSPAEVDLRAIERSLEEVTGCKAAEALAAFGHEKGGSDHAAGIQASRESIERAEIEQLVSDTGRYEGQEQLVREMVELLVTGSDSEALFGELLGKAAELIEEPGANS
jgi:DNA repair exonuclease SbcCD nuclease subunit